MPSGKANDRTRSPADVGDHPLTDRFEVSREIDLGDRRSRPWAGQSTLSGLLIGTPSTTALSIVVLTFFLPDDRAVVFFTAAGFAISDVKRRCFGFDFARLACPAAVP